ncbi:MAG: flagellar basal body P-ring formation chaperone FlgA [Rhodomicrobium sp.]
MRMKLRRLGVAMALCFPAGAFAYDAGGAAVFPALKVTAYPGETITAEMVVLVPAGHQTVLGNIVTEKESLIGKMARRTLMPGLPIPMNALREPYAVHQGKTVSLIFQSGTITITGVAVALESGSTGEIVNARNPDSGTVIRGVVQADGSLRAQ